MTKAKRVVSKRLLLPLGLVGCTLMMFSATPVFAADGESVYKKVCTTCHGPGIAGAPKYGSSADWAPRVAKGKDALYHSALNGFRGDKGFMPPRGGRANLSDTEVKAAVDYMADNSTK